MSTNENQAGCLVSLGQYFAWFVTSLLAVIDALYIRDVVSQGLARFQVAQTEAFHQAGGIGLDFSSGFAMTFVDDVILLTLGIAAIAAVITIEYYFRKGQPQGLLLKRIGIVFGIEIAVIAVSIIIRTIIQVI
jgi:hypothetical protein